MCDLDTVEYFFELINKYSYNNWDGYNAKKFDLINFGIAMKFVALLPLIFPKPEINVDPDGEIALEWYNGSNKLFSISFWRKVKLSYAGYFGVNKVHGVETFENKIPREIIRNIEQIFL